MNIVRGDIHLVDFSCHSDDQSMNLRPAVILSKTEDNALLDSIIVVPFSLTIIDNALPYRKKIVKRETLLQDHDACICEIKTLAKDRIKQKLAHLSSNEINQITHSISQIISEE